MMENDRVYRVYRQRIDGGEWHFVCSSIRVVCPSKDTFSQAIYEDYLRSDPRPPIRIENAREVGTGYSFFNPPSGKRIHNFPIETGDLAEISNKVFSLISKNLK
jgi:hypothetical protein